VALIVLGMLLAFRHLLDQTLLVQQVLDAGERARRDVRLARDGRGGFGHGVRLVGRG